MGKEQALAFAAKFQTSPTPVVQDAIDPAVTESTAPTAVETKTTETPAKDELQSSRLAIFAKKEAAHLKREQELKAKEEALTKAQAEVDAIRARAKEYDDTFKTDKIAALKKLGWTDTDIINAMAEGKTEPTAEEIARRIAAEESEKLEKKLLSQREKEDKERDEKLITGLKSEISSTIKGDTEKFEFCAFEGEKAEADAYQLIEDHLKGTGEMLTVMEALEVVEETYETRARELDKLKKRQPKVEPVVEKTEEAPVSTSERRSQQLQALAKKSAPPTLTNDVRPTSAATTPVSRMETREQKKERLKKLILETGLTR